MKVRFAPSPTGYLHIGNARTAVINYLIARKYNASMVLRIEDTDMERSSRESEESILDDLKWLGISWDEGPDTGGDSGPYRQSERFDIYREYTEKLLSEGKAYYCYCSKDELDSMRRKAESEKSAFTYNGRCRDLTDEQRKAFEDEGRKPTVRFRIPEGRSITVRDHIRGNVQFNSENIGGDFIIVRSDGVPVYNYIVTIDDTLMGVTHVIRGEDHLSNTPKQILIAEALGLPVPEYAHQPLILGPDRSKLSKRHGITSVDLYRSEGYLPESLVNYLAMLGWSTETGDEILSIDQIIEQFDLDGLGKSAAIFDFQKLRWINGNYIRSYPLDRITDLFIPYIREAGYSPEEIGREQMEKIISIVRGYCDVLSEVKEHVGIFIEDVCEPDEDADALLRQEDSITLVSAALEIMKSSVDHTGFSEELIPKIKESTSFKGKKLFHPVRAILTGKLKGPELDTAMPVIGFDKCLKRIQYMHDRYCGNK